MYLSSCSFIHNRNFTIGAHAILGIPEKARSVLSSSKMTIFVLQRMKSALLITLFCSSASCRPVLKGISLSQQPRRVHYLASSFSLTKDLPVVEKRLSVSKGYHKLSWCYGLWQWLFSSVMVLLPLHTFS